MEDVEPPRAERLRQRQRGVRGSCMLGGAPARKREWEREQAGENERVRACRATTMEAEGRVRELLGKMSWRILTMAPRTPSFSLNGHLERGMPVLTVVPSPRPWELARRSRARRGPVCWATASQTPPPAPASARAPGLRWPYRARRRLVAVLRRESVAARASAALRGARRPPHMTAGVEVTRCCFGQLFVAVRMVGGRQRRAGATPRGCR